MVYSALNACSCYSAAKILLFLGATFVFSLANTLLLSLLLLFCCMSFYLSRYKLYGTGRWSLSLAPLTDLTEVLVSRPPTDSAAGGEGNRRRAADGG